MGGTACKAKIILNGSVIESVLNSVCYQIQEADYVGDYDTELKMVEILNHMENQAFAFQRLYLESQGFTGPWPKSMS